MSDTLTSLVARVIYLAGEWLYVVHQNETTFYGVRFRNDPDNPRPEWATVPRSEWASGIDHPLTVVNFWPGMVADFLAGTTAPRVAGDQDTDQAYQRGVQDGRASANREFDAWKESATETAHEYADRNDLCSEFDRCMTDIGLRPRNREFMVTLSLSTTVTLSVTGRDQDDAADNALETFRYSPSSYIDWSSVSVEVDDVEEE